jgi:hypothetical protein
MSGSDHIKQLSFVAFFCFLDAFGLRFLPAGDYQPSRPIYTFIALVIALLVWATKGRTPIWIWSAGRMLTIMFSVIFILTLFM